MSDIGKKIFSGVFWTSVQTIVNRAFGFIIKMILARLLFPEDFGIVGMAVVFTSFIQVFNDLGFGVALIQRDKEKLTDKYYQTAFWTGMFWSIIIYSLVSIIVAPFAASFYGEEILDEIIPVLSLGIVASPVNLVHRAQLTRSMNFKKLAVINNSSSVFSGLLSIILAFMGFGVWSLVFNSVAHFVIAMPQYFMATKWKPKLVWDKKSFRDMFGFGVFTTLSGLISKFASQGDYLIIGKFLGKIDLGLYSFAFIIADALRAQVTSILNSVLFPVYSKLQNSPGEQFKIYGQSVFFNALLITPLMSVLFFAPEIIVHLFGEKWSESIPVLRIIAIAAVVQIITASFPSLLRANNKTKIEFNLQAIKVLGFYIPLIFVGVKYYGLLGVAVAILISRLIGVCINLFVTRKILDLNPYFLLRKFIKGIFPSILGILFFSIIFYFVKSDNLLFILLKITCLASFVLVVSYLSYGRELKNLYKLYKK